MKGFRIILWFGAVALLGSGCSAQATQAHVAEAHPPAAEHRYAAALDEAFSAYESEVTEALAAEYATQAEAEAVALTLQPKRFDAHLARSLSRHGLTVNGLGEFARANPDFYQAQRLRHRGRMDLLRHAVASLAQRAPSQGGAMALR